MKKPYLILLLISLSAIWILNDAFKNPPTLNTGNKIEWLALKTATSEDTFKRIRTIFDSSFYFPLFANLEPLRKQYLNAGNIQRVLDSPVPKYYALTDEDKKSYVLSIDQNAIKKPNDTVIHKEKYRVTYLPVKFSNSSKDTLKYIDMDCSFLDIYLTDNNKVKFAIKPCFKNGPFIRAVPPHETKIVYIPIIVNKNLDKFSQKLRIGMSLQKFIDRSQLLDFNLFTYVLRPKTRNFIWSNVIELP